jgi:bleomycin hydrolase
MKKFLGLVFFAALGHTCFSQVEGTVNTVLLQPFTVEKSILATPVKNQAYTGTCWCFSTTSLVESQCLKKNLGEMDISEMFTVRNIYIEKAKNYLLRQGHAQFGEGGLGHDLIRAIASYGAIPENVYSGLQSGQKMHNHGKLVVALQAFLDSVLKLHPVPQNWLAAYTDILDQALGQPPVSFEYNGKQFTPLSFSKEVLKFDANEYVNITSFTHHPYYQPFIIEVPDNFSNGSYYNLPLDEMIQVTKNALKGGYSVLWDADVSNGGFMQGLGAALYYDSTAIKNDRYAVSRGKAEESKWDANIRQALYENLTTQDDHLMHITGLERSPEGKTFFIVKNSWGNIGPNHGYINVSEAYFAINTISLIIPKAGLSKELLAKLGIK